MKKALIIFMILSLLLLSGCDSDSGSRSRNIDSNGISPDMTILGKDMMEYTSFAYAIDERTEIVYIVFDGYRRGGITVAINSDGTPITKEQLYERYYVKEKE